MNKPIDYEKIVKIELLNEFSMIVYGRVLNFVLNKGIDRNDKENRYVILLNQLTEMLRMDLFNMTHEKLDHMRAYWMSMNDYSKEIIKEQKE